MAFNYLPYRRGIKKIDQKRDHDKKNLLSVQSFRNLRYASMGGRYHKLDLYLPNDSQKPLPVLVIVHGGSWLYGTKETYQFYAQDLARRGFAVVCFNYLLAPRGKFPQTLEDLDEVMVWIKLHREDYPFDLENVFLVGDSAGAFTAAQYVALGLNEEYGKLFSLQNPLPLRGLGLNCGVYSPLGEAQDEESKLIWHYYLGRHYKRDNPHYILLPNLNASFPPSYLFTAHDDIPRVISDNLLMVKRLKELNVPYVSKVYASKKGQIVYHDFQCDAGKELANLANDEECAFFKKLIKN